jgi:hypothetical protein
MAKKKIGQVITRPGRLPSDPPYTIPVPEDFQVGTAIPVRQSEVDFYSREYPIETQNIDMSADRQWAMTILSPEAYEHRKDHERLNSPLVEAARHTGDIAPTGTADPNVDTVELTEKIRTKARDMGFAEVGFTYLNRDYIYKSKKRWSRFDHVICLAMEQNYEPTQTIPSMAAEHTHFGTYRVEGAVSLEFADWIRSMGYHAQHALTPGSRGWVHSARVPVVVCSDEASAEWQFGRGTDSFGYLACCRCPTTRTSTVGRLERGESGPARRGGCGLLAVHRLRGW